LWRPKHSWPLPTSDKMSVVLRHDVRHMHWAGDIPKVACITVIHSSRHTKARMMYFINNFRLQDYEGPRQLVLVYHHTDTDAARLVRSYADASYIKGVATHGVNEFPSAAALRFGAWSSDADVIARWDFDEWHDPSRLSMQIRAMAMASRPACIIRQPHEPHKNDEEKRTPSTSSLAGERTWMDKHWHPFLEGERTVLETSHAVQMVELDMQNNNLASNISHVEAGFRERPDQKTKVRTKVLGMTRTPAAHAWTLPECLAFDNSNSSTIDEHSLEDAVGGTVGVDMSKQFHTLMTRRHDITQKLQLLCLQSVLEKNLQKQVFMWQHVDQMTGILSQLDKHISAMKGLFAVSVSKTSSL